MAGRVDLYNAMPAMDANGNPISGSRAFFYAPGTTTPKAVYTDYALTTPLTQPAVANSAGRWPDIYAGAGELFDVRWETSAGALIATYANVSTSVAAGDFVSSASIATSIPPIFPWNGGTNYATGDKVTFPAYSTIWRASAANFNATPGVAGVWVKEYGFEGGTLTQPLILAAATASGPSMRINTSLTLPTTRTVGDIGCNGGGLWVVLNTGAGVLTHTVLTNLMRRAYRNSLDTFQQIAPGSLVLDDTIPTTSEMNTELLIVGAAIGTGLNRFRITGRTNAFVATGGGGAQLLGIGLFVDGVCIAATVVSVPHGHYVPVTITGEFAPPDLSGRTYSLRVGAPASNTVNIWLNGNNSTALFGGVMQDSLELVEIGGF